jgi:hypothetical protein
MDQYYGGPRGCRGARGTRIRRGVSRGGFKEKDTPRRSIPVALSAPPFVGSPSSAMER